MSTNNGNGAAPTGQLPPPPPEVLAGITFNDQPSVTTEQKPAEPVQTEAKPEEKPSPEVSTEANGKLPSRYESETDVQYDLRVKLFLAGQAKANATTDEEKSILSKEMKRIRDDMAKANQPQSSSQQTPTPPSQTQVPADEREAAKKALEDLGFKTADQIRAEAEEAARKIVDERLSGQQTEQRVAEQTQAITDFYAIRSDIAADDAKRSTLETYVLEMFKPQLPSMNKAQLMQALDMAANYLFPKGSINKKIDSAQTKTDALNIHGSQGGDVSPSTLTDKAKDELRSLGWSDKEIESFEKKK